MAFALLLACAVVPAVVGGQNYRVRLDTRAQGVSLRALVTDSIDASLVVTAANGGLETPDGHAVRCGATAFCYYTRPGAVLRGVPMTTSASVVVWGLGTPGLAFRATGRLMADLGSDLVWPGTDPSAQLIEGYLEYERAAIIARAGRQLIASRLEPMGFDGGWLRYRWNRAALEVTGYGGWGLGQASALVATSPALNPLDEWRPRDRQLVAGAEAAWLYKDNVDLRAEYRREIDPQDHYFVSERTAISMGARAADFRVSGGLDYNMAEARLGSGDLTVTYMRRKVSLSGGVRRYRPYFSLWTLWGAFSPVPYNAVNASVQARPTEWLTVNARGERYRYADAEVSTALVPDLQDRGWRASAGVTATVDPRWTLSGTYSLERGPGASGRFADGAVTFAPSERIAFDLYGGTMARPLELRYYDATSRWVGGRGEWTFHAQRRVWADVAFVNDDRERPDAGASSLSQVRLRGGLSLVFGSGADRSPLPKARRTLP
ncbi:MAG: hypothetical protein OEW77_00665 [Gemmatimonadota bacterium]|nr:hypothetical protein [Gemmatimonadota bacterium]